MAYQSQLLHSVSLLPSFAHQFLDPGTYVFQDNGQPENIAVVLVKEEGAACGAGLSPVQPSSPYQLGRLGVLRHRMLTLGPDWTVITGTNSDMVAGTFQQGSSVSQSSWDSGDSPTGDE